MGSDTGRERVRISSAFLANYAEVRDGLLNTLGAAWANYLVPGLPHSMAGQFVFVVEIEGHDPIALDLQFDILDPTSKVVFTSPVELGADCAEEIVRVVLTPFFQVEVRETGVWHARVLLDDNEVSRVAFEVRQS